MPAGMRQAARVGDLSTGTGSFVTLTGGRA